MFGDINKAMEKLDESMEAMKNFEILLGQVVELLTEQNELLKEINHRA